MTEESKYVRFDWAIKRILRDFFQRILFGTAKNITDQISIGKDYKVIKKVYSINILYFNLGSGNDYAFHGETVFRGMTNKDAVLQFNTDNEKKYIDNEKRRMTSPKEVFPEFFLLIVERFNEVAKTHIEEWMAYLKDGAIREDTTAPGLQAAREKLAYMSMTKEQRKAYDDYMVSVHAARDAWETAIADGREEGYTEGKEIGLAEGREVGLAEGREAGLAEGREAGLVEGREAGIEENKRENARRMKAKGYDIADIADITGLTIEQINSL